MKKDNPNKGRKLKPLAHRVPKDKVNKKEWIRLIRDETGYPIRAIQEIINSMLNVWEQALVEKKTVHVYDFGKIYPFIKPGKNMVDILDDATVFYKDDFYVPKLSFGKRFKKRIEKMEILPGEIDDMYFD